MLGLGNKIKSSKVEIARWDNQGFLSFDGTDDKAEFTVTQPFIASVAGEGNIGDNIGFSFWIKPTWSTSGSYSTTGFAPRRVNFWYLGKEDNNHESVQGYYQLTNSSGTAQNRLWSELRSSTGGNKKQNEFSELHTNNSITGVGTGTTNSWTSSNPSGGAWVHIVLTRGTGEWSQYWNGQALTEGDSDSLPLNIDNDIERVLTFGYKPVDGGFHKYGVRDFAIFSQQLDVDDASTLYNSGNFMDVRRAGINGLGVYYPFNKNVKDIVGGHNLTLTGGTFTAL